MPSPRTSRFDVTPSDAERFARRLVATDTTCLRWSGMTRVVKGHRYAIFHWRSIGKMARTFAWIFAGKGDPPVAGIELGCGNHWCVNADHMRPAVTNKAGWFKPGNSGYKGKGPKQRALKAANPVVSP